MDDIDIRKIHEDADAEVARLMRGLIFTTTLIKRYYEMLQTTGLPEPVIHIIIEHWYRARIRLETEPMLQYMLARDRRAREDADAKQ